MQPTASKYFLRNICLLVITSLLLTGCDPTTLSLFGSTTNQPEAYLAEYFVNVVISFLAGMFFLSVAIAFFVISNKPKKNKKGINILRIMTVFMAVLSAFPAYVATWAMLFGLGNFDGSVIRGDEAEIAGGLLQVFGFFGFLLYAVAFGFMVAAFLRLKNISPENDLDDYI